MIEIRNCTKRYGELLAVNDLGLDVGVGEIFGFLGPNGAGKSTTIKMMVGLIRPDSGSIRIAGNDVTGSSDKAKQLIAYIPEKGYIFEKMTAWEYLKFIGGLYGMDEGTFMDNTEKYLRTFGLLDWKNEMIANFSHGMKQRLLLTSSFMRSPKVLILDEPHNGLDPKGVKVLRDLLYESRDKGMTIVLCTHIIAIAEQMCDNIAIINKGHIIAHGSSDEIKHYAKSDDKNLEDVFLRLTSDYQEQGRAIS
ncbi:MAG: ABC transporter ATP-binding protein [Nitrospirota bacterium]|nr:MAG: ABC transporter ATP-binding protein [Nitrospirota bacterium]